MAKINLTPLAKWDEAASVLVHEMEFGARVIAVFKTMNDAGNAFDAVCRLCLPKANGAVAQRANTRMTIKQGDGSIRFTSERVQLRGCSCDVFYLDPGATLSEWIVPIVMSAKATFNVGGAA